MSSILGIASRNLKLSPSGRQTLEETVRSACTNSIYNLNLRFTSTWRRKSQLQLHITRKDDQLKKGKEMSGPIKSLTKNLVKSGGRNSAGRTTIFHRGGGAKRLLRRIDLKRDVPAMGVIERIEYDPNRSSRIALVRWVDGVNPPQKCSDKAPSRDPISPQISRSSSSTPCSVFSLSSLSHTNDLAGDQAPPRPVASRAVVGLRPGASTSVPAEPKKSKLTSVRDVFLAAFRRGHNMEVPSISFRGTDCFPSFTVVGARPSIFGLQRNTECNSESHPGCYDICIWDPNGEARGRRLSRKATVSWHGAKWQDVWGFTGSK